MKANPWKIIQRHYATFRKPGSTARYKADYAVFLGVPCLVFVLCLAIKATLPFGAATGLLTATGILAAFFFQLVIQMAQRAMELAGDPPMQSKPTKWQIDFLSEVAANAAYACFISVVTAGVFVALLVSHAEALLIIFSAIGLGLTAHLGLLLTMVLARVFALIERPLRTASVQGAKKKADAENVHHLPPRTGSGGGDS